jgi:hypothetical protein
MRALPPRPPCREGRIYGQVSGQIPLISLQSHSMQCSAFCTAQDIAVDRTFTDAALRVGIASRSLVVSKIPPAEELVYWQLALRSTLSSCKYGRMTARRDAARRARSQGRAAL